MPVLGFGAVTLGREIGESESFALLDHAYELGFRIFDTAEAYGGGNSRAYRKNALGVEDAREVSDVMHSSEILLGKWMRSRGIRSEIEIHSKASGNYDGDGVSQALACSVERLGIESISGYYLHFPPDQLVEAISALAEAKQAGRVSQIGICNASQEKLALAHRTAALDLCQNIYNLAQPDPGREQIPWCSARGIRYVAYSPLGAGFLTGKYGLRGEIDPRGTRFDVVPGHRDVYFKPECFAALERLHAVAAATGVSAVRLALSWVLQRSDLSIVLVGATRPEHLDNAVAALRSPVDEQILAELDSVPAQG